MTDKIFPVTPSSPFGDPRVQVLELPHEFNPIQAQTHGLTHRHN